MSYSSGIRVSLTRLWLPYFFYQLDSTFKFLDTEAEHKSRHPENLGGAYARPLPNMVEEERLFLQHLSEEQEELVRSMDEERAQREREEQETILEIQRLSTASQKTGPPHLKSNTKIWIEL